MSNDTEPWSWFKSTPEKYYIYNIYIYIDSNHFSLPALIHWWIVFLIFRFFYPENNRNNLLLEFLFCLFVRMGISGEFSPWLIFLVISTLSSWLLWHCSDRKKEYGHLQPLAMSFRQEICPFGFLSLYIVPVLWDVFHLFFPHYSSFLFPYLSSLS